MKEVIMYTYLGKRPKSLTDDLIRKRAVVKTSVGLVLRSFEIKPPHLGRLQNHFYD